ncbi:MAG TPA: FMN-binding protein [bacterium]|nr:FMN-binding protein [bacterium]
MKEIVKFAVVLCLVMMIAAVALSYVHSLARPRILAQQQKDLMAGLIAVLPGSELGVITSHPSGYYTGYASKDSSDLIGHAFPVVSRGYSSDIRTLVGLDTAGVILSVKILFQQETPGLGTRIEETRRGESEPWFQNQFRGKSIEEIRLDKDGGPIQGITGATITSKAVTDGVRIGLRRFQESVNAAIQNISE